MIDWVAQMGLFQVRSMARHVVIVRPRSGNSALSSGKNCGRKRSPANTSEVGGKNRDGAKGIDALQSNGFGDGAPTRKPFETQIGHVKVVPDDSFVRCDN